MNKLSQGVILHARKLDFPTDQGELVQRSEITYVLNEPYDEGEDQRGHSVFKQGVEGHALYDQVTVVPGLYELTEQSRSKMVNGRPIREMVVTRAELIGAIELPFSEVTA